MAPRSMNRAEELIGLREGERLELKSGEILEHPARLLGEIVAFLNAEGGDIYIGVEEENGVATAVPGVEDPAGIHRLMDLLADRIEPIPPSPTRTDIPADSGRPVIQLRVPKGEDGPYALRESASYRFPLRFGDRIRHRSWLQIRREIDGPGEGDPAQEARELMLCRREEFLANRTGEPTLRVAIAPTEPKEDLFRGRDEEVRLALEDVGVTGNRYSGWTYQVSELARWSPEGEVRRRQRRWEQGGKESPYRHLVIEENGWITFTTAYDHGWTWHAQAMEERGERGLDPFVLVEYPASVVRLGSWLYDKADLRGSVLLELVLRDIEGIQLGAGHPSSPRYRFRKSWKVCDQQDILVGPTAPIEVTAAEFRENPDPVTYGLVSEVYEEFEFGEADIPFFQRESRKLVFP